VGRTLDQAVAGVEKLVGLPFQPDAPVRAAIFIDIHPTAPAYGQELLTVDVETATAGVSQFGACAKKLHVYPQVLRLVTRYVRA
jgi:hypothetical protein